MVAAPRIVDFDAFAELESSGKLEVFLRSHFEQRAIVLHNRSVKEGRMVKFVEVRDLNQASIATLLTRGRPLMQFVKRIIALVQDFYPEMVHQVLIFNAPAAMARLLSVANSVMNERMRSKLQVFPSVEAQVAFSSRLTAKAIWSWTSQLASAASVANGAAAGPANSGFVGGLAGGLA